MNEASNGGATQDDVATIEQMAVDLYNRYTLSDQDTITGNILLQEIAQKKNEWRKDWNGIYQLYVQYVSLYRGFSS